VECASEIRETEKTYTPTDPELKKAPDPQHCCTGKCTYGKSEVNNYRSFGLLKKIEGFGSLN